MVTRKRLAVVLHIDLRPAQPDLVGGKTPVVGTRVRRLYFSPPPDPVKRIWAAVRLGERLDNTTWPTE